MIKGIMSESLHVKGIMSKEFSAIRCLDFNGSGDYIIVPDNASLDPRTGDFTIMIWFKSKHIDNYRTMIRKVGSDGSYYSLRMTPPDGKLQFYGAIAGVIAFNQYTKTEKDDDIWYDAILVWHNGISMKIYINGLFDNQDSSVNSGDVNTAGNNLQITYPVFGFEGMIAVIRKWKRALSPEEIAGCHLGNIPRDNLVAEWLMREQKGNKIYDTSVNSNTGTLYGAPDWYEKKFNTPLKGIMSNSSEITGTMTAEYT